MVGVQLDVEEFASRFQRPKGEAGQEAGDGIELVFREGFGAGVLHPEGPVGGIEGADTGVLVAVVAGYPGDAAGGVEGVPALEEGRGASDDGKDDLLRVSAVIEEKVRQDAPKPELFEVGVDVEDFHAGEFGSVPIARLLWMREEEESAALHDLAGKGGVVGGVAEDDTRAHAERHESLPHLKPGNEESAFDEAAPLGVEVGTAIGAVVAQADEIEVVGVQDAKDVGKGHLTIVRKFAVAMDDAAEFLPTSGCWDGLAGGAEGQPVALFAGEPEEPVVEGRTEPEEQEQAEQGQAGQAAEQDAFDPLLQGWFHAFERAPDTMGDGVEEAKKAGAESPSIARCGKARDRP